MTTPTPESVKALADLADRVEACTEPTRELADEVLLACGWRLNHDAADIAAWRIDAGVVEGEDGKDYPVTLEERMTWACWYKPGNRPFRDSWIDGPCRPNPLTSLDAAMTLVPKGWAVEGLSWWPASPEGASNVSAEQASVRMVGTSLDRMGRKMIWGHGGKDGRVEGHAPTSARAIVAAALRARAHIGASHD